MRTTLCKQCRTHVTARRDATHTSLRNAVQCMCRLKFHHQKINNSAHLPVYGCNPLFHCHNTIVCMSLLHSSQLTAWILRVCQVAAHIFTGSIHTLSHMLATDHALSVSQLPGFSLAEAHMLPTLRLLLLVVKAPLPPSDVPRPLTPSHTPQSAVPHFSSASLVVPLNSLTSARASCHTASHPMHTVTQRHTRYTAPHPIHAVTQCHT